MIHWTGGYQSWLEYRRGCHGPWWCVLPPVIWHSILWWSGQLNHCRYCHCVGEVGSNIGNKKLYTYKVTYIKTHAQTDRHDNTHNTYTTAYPWWHNASIVLSWPTNVLTHLNDWATSHTYSNATSTSQWYTAHAHTAIQTHTHTHITNLVSTHVPSQCYQMIHWTETLLPEPEPIWDPTHTWLHWQHKHT